MTDPSAFARLTPAPARGHYDRRQTSEGRHQQQRIRLLAALAVELRLRGPERATVGGVVRRAGMGKNTFYRHFTGLVPAQAAAQQQHCQALEQFLAQVLSPAHTPLEKLRALARGWLDFAVAQSKAGGLAPPTRTPRRGPPGVPRILAEQLARVFGEARKTGTVSVQPSPLLLEALAAAWHALGDACAEHRADPLEARFVLADLALRAVR